MSTRDRILGRLRQSLADAPGAGDPHSAHLVTEHQQATAPAWPLSERLQRLVTAMRAVQTEVHLVRATTWPQRLAQVVQAHGVRSLLLSPGTSHGQLAQSAVQALPEPPRCLAFDRDIEHWKAELFTQVDAGFTQVRSGIAATGTLVLWPDANEPRTMSLVPPLHITLLDGQRVHARLADLIAAESWVARGLPTNALLVSGPSKTSDIQQTLAYGAHGPRALVLLLVVPDDIDLDALAQATGATA